MSKDSWKVMLVAVAPDFALAAARFLTRSLGFGSESSQTQWESADGRGVVFYHRDPSKLDPSRPDLQGRNVFWLVAESAEAELVSLFPKSAIFPVANEDAAVSSRPAAGCGLRRIPQSYLQVLRSVRASIGKPSKVRTIASVGKGVHVLVTGAGFEMRGSDSTSIGLPTTRELLVEMGEPFFRGKKPGGSLAWVRLDEQDLGYPLPILYDRKLRSLKPKKIEKSLKGLKERLNEAAKEQHLDEYWNCLLELRVAFAAHAARRPATDQDQDEAKLQLLRDEADLREAFRRQILKYDWGQMKQSLTAAFFPWHAWVTTNYTQFADRAIAETLQVLDEDEAQALQRLGRWRIVASSAEAQLARDELAGEDLVPARPRNHETGGGWQSLLRRHGDTDDARTGDARTDLRSSLAVRRRFLFKLHGDIGDARTMAIAGHDKGVTSPLAVRIEALQSLYNVTEAHLIRSLRQVLTADDKTHVVWHIVGHGMADRRLARMIANVSNAVSGESWFRLVSPDPTFRNQKEMGRQLVKAEVNRSSVCLGVALTAEQYLEHLFVDKDLTSIPEPSKPLDLGSGQLADSMPRRKWA